MPLQLPAFRRRLNAGYARVESSLALRLVITAGATAVYFAALPTLLARIGPPAGALAIIPVVVAAALFGALGGAAAGAAILPMNIVAYAGAGFAFSVWSVGLAVVVFSLIGVIVGRFRDLSGGLHAEEAKLRAALELLAEREAMLSMAQSVSHTGSWIQDTVSGFTHWSAEMYAVMGVGPGFRPGFEAFLELVHPDDRQRIIDARDAHRSATDGFDLEVRLLNPEGSVRYLHTRVKRIPGPSGEATRLLGTTQDVTEVRELQAKMLLADRLASVGTLAGGVAHEINNPLSFVITNLGFVTELLAPSDLDASLRTEISAALSDASTGAERIRSIVKGLKTFSRADDETKGPVDLSKVAELAIAMTQNEVRHRAQLRKDLARVPKVLANESRLGQLVTNLLINAAQAIPEGRADDNEISLRVLQPDPSHVAIEVRDTGVGIPVAIRRRIFDPFFTTKPIGMGTGLGLAICHGIVQSFGGEITVESEVGQGSTFRVVLPIMAEQPMSPSAVVEDLAKPRRARILIVDDEPMLGRALGRWLSTDNDIQIVTEGREAARRLEAGGTFDIILCDLMMPQMTGMELYDLLESQSPETARKMVFLTGGAFTPKARDFLERIKNPVLPKPIDINGLRRLIKERMAS